MGQEYTAWTDHQPFLSIYNNGHKPTTKRIASHRDKIQDLKFHVKHLKGNQMPCDYGSRHTNPINHLTQEEQDRLGFDVGNEIYVRKSSTSAARPVYSLLISYVMQPTLIQATSNHQKTATSTKRYFRNSPLSTAWYCGET